MRQPGRAPFAESLRVALLQEAGHGGPEDGGFGGLVSHPTRPDGSRRARRLLHPEGRQRGPVPGGSVPRRQSGATVHHAQREGGAGVPEGPAAQRHRHRGEHKLNWFLGVSDEELFADATVGMQIIQ